jgi:hypothetical protein
MQIDATAVLRPDLADAVLEYEEGNLNSQYMATEILPVYETQTKTGEFAKVDVSEVKKDIGTGARAPGSGYDRISHIVTADNYACVEYGFEEIVDDSDKTNVDQYFNSEVATTELLVNKLRRAQEVRVAAAVFNATTFTSQTAGVGTEWDTAATATPFQDISDILPTIKANMGGVVDGEICLAISEKVFQNVLQTTEIKNMRFGGVGADVDQRPATKQELAQILGIDRVFCSGSQNSGTDIWDDEYAMIFVRNQSRSLRSQVQMGRSFLWVADSPENANVESYRDEPVRSDVIRVRHNIDEKILTVEAAYLLSNITT